MTDKKRRFSLRDLLWPPAKPVLAPDAEPEVVHYPYPAPATGIYLTPSIQWDIFVDGKSVESGTTRYPIGYEQDPWRGKSADSRLREAERRARERWDDIRRPVDEDECVCSCHKRRILKVRHAVPCCCEHWFRQNCPVPECPNAGAR